jgi:hypothetical protein
MSQPTGGQIQAALDAMRQDSHTWRHMAAELSEAARVANRLDLGQRQFSFAADRVGVTRLYQDIQEKMVKLMEQGAANFESIAQALYAAADGYEEDERRNVHQLKNIY